MNDHDPINHPAHYTSRPVECIEITRLLPFALGNSIKYLWRAGLKGDPAEDLGKARWYLRDWCANPVSTDIPGAVNLVELIGTAFPSDGEGNRCGAIMAVAALNGLGRDPRAVRVVSAAAERLIAEIR